MGERKRYPSRDRAIEVRHHRRRLWLLENGPCKQCGTWDDLQADHVDPATKTVEVDDWWARGGQTLESELAKCQVLCKGCHRRKSILESQERNGGAARHGTYSKYIKGCRCAACCEANTTYHYNRRRRLGIPTREIGPAVWVELPEGKSHGTRTAYEFHKCRCAECRVFNANRSQTRRDRMG